MEPRELFEKWEAMKASWSGAMERERRSRNVMSWEPGKIGAMEKRSDCME